MAAAALVAAVMPLVADGVASGKILGPDPDQVALVVTVDCDRIAADPAAPLVVHAAWDWTGGEPLAGGSDGFAVDWVASTDADTDGEVGLYVDGEVETAPPDAVWSGSGGPASALIDQFEAEGGGRTFGIDVARAGLVDGHVAFSLRAVSPVARHGSLEVWAHYAHLDHWMKDSGPVSCQW